MHKLDETLNAILKLLSNGHWHKVEEITERTSMTEDKIEKAIQFLNEFEFIEVRGREVRIRELGLKLLEF